MKKIFTFLLLTSLFNLKAQTPITLTRADFPCPSAAACGLPDSILYTSVPISSTVNTSSSGASSTWDMSMLANGTPNYQKLLPMSATPFIFQLAFLSCDFVQPLLGNTAVGGLPVADAFEYFNYAGTSSSRLEIKGFGANVTIPGSTLPIPLPAVYTSPDIIYQFPIAYGNKDSSLSGYSLTIPLGGTIGDVTFKRKQKRVNEVDGWGSIITPAGTFDVLRLKSSIDRIDSLITGFIPIGFPSKPLEYKWLGNTKQIPVFQVNGTVFGSNFTPNAINFWGVPKVTGIEEIGPASNLFLFPNPTKENCSIQYFLTNSSDLDILITNLEGKLVGEFHFKNQQGGKHTEILPLSALSNGTYLVRCISNSKVISNKLVKFY
jgi:hypothetical protein